MVSQPVVACVLDDAGRVISAVPPARCDAVAQGGSWRVPAAPPRRRPRRRSSPGRRSSTAARRRPPPRRRRARRCDPDDRSRPAGSRQPGGRRRGNVRDLRVRSEVRPASAPPSRPSAREVPVPAELLGCQGRPTTPRSTRSAAERRWDQRVDGRSSTRRLRAATRSLREARTGRFRQRQWSSRRGNARFPGRTPSLRSRTRRSARTGEAAPLGAEKRHARASTRPGPNHVRAAQWDGRD